MLLNVKVHMKIRAATEETWFYITHIKIYFCTSTSFPPEVQSTLKSLVCLLQPEHR